MKLIHLSINLGIIYFITTPNISILRTGDSLCCDAEVVTPFILQMAFHNLRRTSTEGMCIILEKSINSYPYDLSCNLSYNHNWTIITKHFLYLSKYK